jgi:hypothetical protein
MVLTLNENFDNIACVDFAKRVKLNRLNKRSVDIFKIKENLSITTHDELGRHTFYRNSNPIQTANIINEHMDLNVSNLFEELQSNSEQVREEIEATKKSYENCIAELKEKLTQLDECGESCGDEKDVKTLNELRDEVENELARVENDYKEYQKTSDEFLNGQGDVDSEDPALVNGVEADYGEEENTDVFSAEDDVNSEDGIDTTSVEQPIENEPSEYDGLFDETPYNNEPTQGVEDPYAPSIVNISYAENIKTGTIVNRGEVNVLIPSVDANGDVKNELQRITFTLDADRNPIINNEYMPVALYNKIKDAILAHEQTQSVDVQGTASFDEPTTIEEPTSSAPVQQPDLFFDEEPVSDVDTNPIDAAYGVEEEPVSNGVEDENIPTTNDDLFGNEEATDDEEVKPELTEEPAPEDLEAAGSSNAVKMVITMEDLYDNDIKDEDFVAFLKSHNIPGLRGTNGTIRVVIRDFETYNKFREFFLDRGWTKSEFNNFFHELNIFESVRESKVVVSYSNNLETILESNNLPHKISKKGDKIMILNAICEGVVITVKDDKTGKTVTINTDELNDTDEEAQEHEENTQDDVTFGDDNAQTEPSNEDGEEEASEDTNGEEETPNESNEGGSEPKEEEKKEDKKVGKKFRIKKKKTDESLGVTEYDNALNEGESVEVLDEVKYKNKNGNVVSKLTNGDIIVEFGAQTDVLKPSAIKVVTNEIPKKVLEPTTETDSLPTNESYCGIFFNGMRISPSNCTTNVESYKNAKANDLIDIVVEGVKSSIEKQYVKLLS